MDDKLIYIDKNYYKKCCCINDRFRGLKPSDPELYICLALSVLAHWV